MKMLKKILRYISIHKKISPLNQPLIHCTKEAVKNSLKNSLPRVWGLLYLSGIKPASTLHPLPLFLFFVRSAALTDTRIRSALV